MEAATFTSEFGCDISLGASLKDIAVDEAALLGWMREHGGLPDQTSRFLIYLSNDRPVAEGRRMMYGTCTRLKDNSTVIPVYCGWAIYEEIEGRKGKDASINDASNLNSKLRAMLYHEVMHYQVRNKYPAIAKAAERHTKLFSMIKEAGSLAIRGAAFAASAAAVLAGGYILERMGIKDARVISTGAVAAGGLVFAGTMFASHKLTTAFDAWVGIKEYKHNPEEKICRSVENDGPPVIQASFKDNFAEHYQPARCITAKEAEEKAIHLLLNEEAGIAA